MSATIDERVVEMRFDNKQFEAGVSTTMSTLDKLKAALNFKGAGKALDELADAGNKFSLDGMGSAVDGVGLKFDAMGSVAFTVLQRITNAAIDTAKKIEQSLGAGLAGMAAGWQKYGDKNTAVATLVGQGYAMEEVNEQLDRLNWFTDETSYNFIDMVSNIGKFTATGQKLDSSVQAMMGIADWAAMSGQNATTASRAMYQLSQAMGKGVLKYDDWKSIQNASMDTLQFREQAVQAAEALGILKANADSTYTLIGEGMKGTFTMAELFSSDALSRQQWFTSQVMMDTFKKYSAAVDQVYAYADANDITATQAIEELQKSGQVIDEFGLKAFRAAQEARTFGDVMSATADAVGTAWMKVWETVIGDYEESRTVFTQMAEDLYDIFAQPVNDLQEMLFSGLASGWKRMAKDSGISTKKMKEQLTTYAEASGVALDDLIKEYGSFEASLKGGWVTNEMLAASFQDLEDRLSTLSEDELLKEGFTTKQLEDLRDLNAEFRSGKRDISEWVESLSAASGRENLIQAVWNLRDALFAFDEENDRAIGVIAIFKEAFGEVFPALEGDTIYAITERIREFTQSLIPSEEKADKLRRTFKGVASVFDIVRQVGTGVWDTIKSIVSVFTDGKTDILEFAASIGDSISEFAESGKIGEFFTNASETLTNTVSQVYDKVSSFITSLSPVFSGIWDFVQKLITGIAEIFGLVGDTPETEKLSGIQLAFEVLSTVVSSLWSALEKVRDVIVDIFTGDSIDGATGALDKLFGILQNIADFATDVFGGIWNFIKDFGANIRDALSKVTAEDVKNVGVGILSGIIGTKALHDIYNSNLTTFIEFLRGTLTGIQDIADGLWESLHGLANSQNTSALLKFAAAIGILAVSLLILSGIDPEALGDALLSLTVIIGLLVLTMREMADIAVGPGVRNMPKIGTALLLLGGALLLASISLTKLAKLSWGDIFKSLVGMLGVLALLTGAAVLLGRAKNAGKGAGSLLVISFALLIVAGVLKILATMEWPDIGRSLTAMGGALILLVGAAAILGLVKPKAAINALAVAIIAAALITVSIALKILSTMDWKEMGVALISMGAALAALVGATVILGLVSPKAAVNALAVAIIAAALIPVSIALKILSTMDWKEMGVALISMGAALVALVGATVILGLVSPVAVVNAFAVAVLAGALLIVSMSLKILSTMDWKEMGVALISMGVALAALVGATVILGLVSPLSVVNALTVIVLAVALNIVAKALVTLSAMNWTGMGVALISMGVALLALVGVTAILGLIPPTAIAGAAAFVLVAETMVDVIDTIGEVIAKLMQIGDPDKAIAIASKLEEFLGIMALVIAGLGAVASIGGGAVGAGMALAGFALNEVANTVLVLSEAMVNAGQGIRDISQYATPEALDRVGEAGKVLAAFGVKLGEMHFAGSSGINDLNKIAGPLTNIFAAFSGLDSFVSNDIFGNLISGILEFGSAVEENAPVVIAAVQVMVDDSASKASTLSSRFYAIGVASMDGYVNGFTSRLSWACSAVAGGMTDIANAAAAALAVNSPSKVFANLGMYSVLGYAVGWEEESPTAVNAIADTILKISEYIDENQDYTPTIRPVLDLSNVAEGASQIGGYFSATQAVGIAARMNSANAVNTAYGDDSGNTAGPTYSFVQNNYSPKALNRLEIYRQTRNQISAIEGARAV